MLLLLCFRSFKGLFLQDKEHTTQFGMQDHEIFQATTFFSCLFSHNFSWGLPSNNDRPSEFLEKDHPISHHQAWLLIRKPFLILICFIYFIIFYYEIYHKIFYWWYITISCHWSKTRSIFFFISLASSIAHEIQMMLKITFVWAKN